MTHAIRFYQTGGPEVMRWEKVGADDTAQNQSLAMPGPGQVRIVHHAIGVNFIDTYF